MNCRLFTRFRCFGQSAGPAVVSALLAAALFAVTLGGTYVYDDFDVFLLDQRLRQPNQWWRYWTQSYNAGVDNLYRPLVSMTYAAQWWLHGADQTIDQSDAWKYHLVNVLLHAAVSAAVAEFARRLAGAGVAWIAGLLFAAHPIHVEAVANIVGRAELMCALGVVGALVLSLKPMSVRRALAITACFILAAGSKEQGILTPLLILLLALVRTATCRTAGTNGGQGSRRANLTLVLLLSWSLAAYLVFRESILKFGWDRSFLDWTINPLVRADADRWVMPLVLLGRYFALLVAPLKLSPDYGARVIGWQVNAADPYLWLGVAALGIWTAWLAVATRRRDGAAVFCLLALALTYGIVSNFPMLIGTIFAERLMYLPSVFFLILVALILSRMPGRAIVPIMIVLCTGYGWKSFTYARRWNDALGFYQISLREQPRSIRLHLLLASELKTRGEIEQAARVAEQASAELPEYWEGWVARADIALKAGRFDEADEYLLTAINTPGSPMPRISRWMARVDEMRRASTLPSTTPSD